MSFIQTLVAIVASPATIHRDSLRSIPDQSMLTARNPGLRYPGELMWKQTRLEEL